MDNEFVGSHFESLSQEEMDFVTGANGGAQPLVTPASPVLITISRVVSGGAASYVVSWVASAWVNCRD